MKKNHCKIHGEMFIETAYACKNPNGTIRLRCKICCNERRVLQYYSNREENIKKSCEWKKENREHANEWERENRKKDITLTRAKETSRKKGIKLDHYYSMIEEQNNKCAICNQEETRKNRSGEKSNSLSIDHNHKTGKIRQLLCWNCNVGIGKFKEDIELLQSAILYLKKHIPIIA